MGSGRTIDILGAVISLKEMESATGFSAMALAPGIFFPPPFLLADILLNRRVFSFPFSLVSIGCKNEDRFPLTPCVDDGRGVAFRFAGLRWAQILR